MFRAPRPLANIVAGYLRSNGIDCLSSSDDFDGWHPEMDFAHGTRLLVRRSDEERARELISEAETEPS